MATGSNAQFDFSVSVKMIRVSGKLVVGVAPDVELAIGRSGGRLPGPLKPRMLVGGVIHDQLDQYLDPPFVSRLYQPLKSSSVP